MSTLWNTAIMDPMVNALVLLYDLLGNNFVFALASFTLLVRFALLPLTLRQQKATMKTQQMQPQIQAIQKKYRDNPQKMQEEFQRIGYNPAETLMGCLPLVIQMPIFFGLYRAIYVMLGSTPLSVFNLTDRVYPWVSELVDLSTLLPIENQFLWMNMAQPDPLLVLPIMVGLTMFISQKLMLPSTQQAQGAADNPMAGMTQTMTYTMPLMFGFFSLSFPAGLSVYFVLSNVVSIGQGFIIRRNRESLQATMPAPKAVELDAGDEPAEGKAKSNGSSKSKPKAKASSNGSGRKNGARAGSSNGKKKQQYNKKKRRAKR